MTNGTLRFTNDNNNNDNEKNYPKNKIKHAHEHTCWPYRDTFIFRKYEQFIQCPQ